MAEAKAQILGPGEGRSLATAGVTISIKSGADDTDGRRTILEYTAPPRFGGPPPHWHGHTEEVFFVLEGTVRFEVEGETRDVSAGG